MTVMQALYKGIEASWNFNFTYAEILFSYFTKKGDIRHSIHKIELNLLKVLITGKKSLIDKCLTKIIKLEDKLNNIK